MKHLIKIISLISTLCIILGMLSGCSGTEVTAEMYDASKYEMVNEENGVVFEDPFDITETPGDDTESDPEIIPEDDGKENSAENTAEDTENDTSAEENTSDEE